MAPRIEALATLIPKKMAAYSPANGFSAIAASWASFILIPWGNSVFAHVTIIKKAIILVIKHPTVTSTFEYL